VPAGKLDLLPVPLFFTAFAGHELLHGLRNTFVPFLGWKDLKKSIVSSQREVKKRQHLSTLCEAFSRSSRSFQGLFKDFSRTFQGLFKDFSRTFQGLSVVSARFRPDCNPSRSRRENLQETLFFVVEPRAHLYLGKFLQWFFKPTQ
jgi:hypothetical protein